MRALTFLLSAAVATLVLAAPVAADRRVCLTFGNIYYDIKTAASGTTLERWSNGNLLDSNWYAQLTQPPSGTMWGDGVAYAATMQTRHVWVNTELNSPASWEVVNGEDVWTYDTTISGSPTQLVFRSSNCQNMVPPSPTPALPTADPNALRRVCGVVGTTLFNMWTSPAGTTMQRFSQGRWLQTQDFAPLHMAAAGQMWSEGVVFAATMQTRHSWFNTEPNPTARWEVVNGEDFWSFDTVMNGNPQTITFRTSNCMGDATPVPPTAEPVRRVCMIDYGASKYYEARTSSAGTYWDRRDYPSGNLIDSNWFAKLNEPVPQEAMWGEGVAFAATMQTRHVWINTEPNTEAYWLRDSQQDRWTFKTTFEGLGVEYQLIENACVNDWNSIPKPV